MNDKQNRRFKAVVNNIDDGILIFDNEGLLTGLNPSAEKITGFKEQMVLGKTFKDLFSVDILGPDCDTRNDLLKDKYICKFETEVISGNGKGIPLSVSLVLLKDNKEDLIGYAATLRKLEALKKQSRGRYEFSNMISKNHRMQEIFDLVETISDCDVSVLIQGESGTGKELIAHSIHDNSRRHDKPFIVLNCGAISESILESELFGHVKGAFSGAYRDNQGRFETAHGGTLLLDEIGDISLNMQVKLLRVLQTGRFERVGSNSTTEVDVRIIAATNKNLSEEIQRGSFREDLFYRLNVVPVFMPPLRERKEDIPLLVKQFINMFNKKNNRNIKDVSINAMCLLMGYDWPGNIRELKNIIECSLVCAKINIIEPSAIPLFKNNNGHCPAKQDENRKKTAPSSEKQRILFALKGCMGNKTAASEILNIDRTTLWRKIKRYGINVNSILNNSQN